MVREWINTKVYKATNDQIARQQIEGWVESGGCAIVLSDPIVPYADSKFEQEQIWHLDEGAVLVLLDGGTAGRIVRGERFQYGSYRSNITIYMDDEPVLIERFTSTPGRQPPDRVGAFGAFAAFANDSSRTSPSAAVTLAAVSIVSAV